MDRRDRIKYLLSLPSYRLRLGFFMVLGILTILVAFLFPSSLKDVKDVLVQIAIVFISVGLIDFMWDFLGGDPTELRMTSAFSDVDNKLETISHSMSILSDIVDGNIGIERIWPNRRRWENDSTEGLVAWKIRVCQAKVVDMVSNTLYNRWFHDESFQRDFFGNLSRGSVARILIYNPLSPVQSQRAKDEKDPGGGRQMCVEIESTLEKIIQNRATLDENVKKNIRVRLTSEYYHLAQIIRADERILVGIYLSGKTGSPSPTLQLRGPQSAYYLTYKDQIDILWDGAGQDLSDDELQQIITKSRSRK